MKATVALMLLAVAVQQGTSTVESGFTSLFNGKDLSGWKISGAQESFAVRDGAIVASGPASHLYYDGPFKDHRFRNFELKIDVMVRPGSNGGVYVLTEFEMVGATNERPASSHRKALRSRSTTPTADREPAASIMWSTFSSNPRRRMTSGSRRQSRCCATPSP
jgi:hypothetical protein